MDQTIKPGDFLYCTGFITTYVYYVESVDYTYGVANLIVVDFDMSPLSERHGDREISSIAILESTCEILDSSFARNCNCPIVDLMNIGCKCGGN